MLLIFFVNKKNYIFAIRLSDGVIGNTSDFGSEESRFEPWSDNSIHPNPSLKQGGAFLLPDCCQTLIINAYLFKRNLPSFPGTDKVRFEKPSLKRRLYILDFSQYTWIQSISVLYVLVLFLFSCENSFDLTIKSKSTSFVYCIINTTDTVHYIRINKSFISDDNAYAYLDIADSMNFKNLTIKVELFDSLRGNVVLYPEKTTDIPKDTGTFYSEPNLLYFFIFDLNPFTDCELTIINTDYSDTIYSYTKLSKPGKFYLPGIWTSSDQVCFYGNGYRMFWKTGTGYYNGISMTFHYSDFIDGTKVPRLFNYLLQYSYLPLSEKEFFFTLDDFLYTVKSRVLVNPSTSHRVFDSIDFHLTSADYFLQEYSKLFSYSPLESSLVNFTNIQNGCGIFSSKARTNLTGFRLDVQAMDSLVSSQLTKSLKFVDY